MSIFAIGVENFDLSVNKRGDQFGLPFSYSASCSSNSNPMRSNSSKNSAVSSSSVLEDSWGKGVVSSIGWTSFVQVRAVCPSPPQLLHFWGDRFFAGSESAIIISRSALALRVVSTKECTPTVPVNSMQYG